MSRRLLLVAAGALVLAGCGDDARATRSDAPAREDLEDTVVDGIVVDGAASDADRRVLRAFDYVPDGFEYGSEQSWARDPRGKAPGTAAAFVHPGDCCEAGDRLHYPPTVLVRKFPDEGTLPQLVRYRVAEAKSVPGLVEGSLELSTLTDDGLGWRRLEYTFEVAGLEHPQRASLLLARDVDRITREFGWLTSELDADALEPELLRMWRELDWKTLPVEDF